MFTIRPVKTADLNQLFDLSQLLVFINLPADIDKLAEKINISINSFSNPSLKKEDNYYIFVIEEIKTKKVVGVSMIHGQHGTEKEPHFYLKVNKEQKYSESLNTGFIHGTLKFGMETEGWSEIGGLILHPDYRGHKDKVGKQLSFVRFLYMGLNPDQFTEIVHSELMPPFTSTGDSPLWEAIGRRFLNMDYSDADLLSRKNKEFILSLYPSENIYVTLLPTDARNAIGKVGKETEPVKKMLESIGFCYTNEIDPFDGGPHFRAYLSDISLVRTMIKRKLKYVKNLDKLESQSFLVAFKNPQSEFNAIKLEGSYDDEFLYVTENYNKIIDIDLNPEVSSIFF